MTTTDIQTYLSNALDQEACRDTLITALRSRVVELQTQGISQVTLFNYLQYLANDEYQINDDIIYAVMDMLMGWADDGNIES